MWIVGLTDNPDIVRARYGNPPDWRQIKFESEEEARARSRCFAAKDQTNSLGWRFGFWFSVSKSR